MVLMCVVSMVGDYYNDRWRKRYDRIDWRDYTIAPDVTRGEFEDLRKEVEQLKELLKRAKQYDEDNNEPDCEIDEKMEVLRQVAKIFQIDLGDILEKKPTIPDPIIPNQLQPVSVCFDTVHLYRPLDFICDERRR